ncbi:MAG: Rare lipoprotein [Pedosphaera sp.]|nr:Rare lipoprotein [Pedosphaera sp.]
MKNILLLPGLLVLAALTASAEQPPAAGHASWYGEDHRGKLMANGKPFDPDKLTAASWFYPLGTKVQVILQEETAALPPKSPHTVLVVITDRGPARRLVNQGRIIDLSQAAFKELAAPELGLIPVEVRLVP